MLSALEAKNMADEANGLSRALESVENGIKEAAAAGKYRYISEDKPHFEKIVVKFKPLGYSFYVLSCGSKMMISWEDAK